MIKNIGVFATNSYTELTIRDFLLKIRDEVNINWDVRIPLYSAQFNNDYNKLAKPPKIAIKGINVHYPLPIEGQSGSSLISKVIDFFQVNPSYLQYYDAILLEDDLDNRSKNINPAYDINCIVKDLHTGISEVCPGYKLPPIYALLAVPEIESWFIADWEKSFGQELLDFVSMKFFDYVNTYFLSECEIRNIERYSGTKLSDRLRDDLNNIVINLELSDEFIRNNESKLCYRKERDKTQRMLASIRPDIVAGICVDYFLITYKILKEL